MPDSGHALRCRRNFYQEVRPIYLLHPVAGFGNGRLRVSSKSRRDLHRDESVASGGRTMDAEKHIARAPDVISHQRLDDFFCWGAGRFEISQGFGVVGTAYDRPREDGGIRGHAGDRVFFEPSGQLTGIEHGL